MMKQTKSHTDRKETTMIDPLSQNHAQENTRAADADTLGWTLNRVLLGLGAIGPVLFLAVATLLGRLDRRFGVMT